MVINLKTIGTGDMRHKVLPFSETSVKASDGKNPDVAGEIHGFAAGLLNIDRGQDIIFPGAFKDDLPEFLLDGVVAYQHDFTAIIGKPVVVEEKLAPDYGLYAEAEIINTSLGEDVMKLVRRKVLKSLSIGYTIKEGGYSILNRETLAATLKDRSIDPVKTTEILADFDRRKLESVFGLFKIKLYEYSVVTRPMNQNAAITDAKNDGGLLDGLPFSYHPLQVLAAVRGYAQRVEDSVKRYSEKDRNLSQIHKCGITDVREELEKLLPKLKEIESLATIEKANQDDVSRVLADIYIMESRLNGVSV